MERAFDSSRLQPMRRLRDGLRQVVDLAFGYDFFISYKHDDGGTYPSELARRLHDAGFTVFIDQGMNLAGEDLNAITQRRVTMSTYLLLLARPGAMARSRWVLREIQTCITAERTPI